MSPKELARYLETLRTEIESKKTQVLLKYIPGSVDGGGSGVCCECVRSHRVSDLGVDSELAKSSVSRDVLGGLGEILTYKKM